MHCFFIYSSLKGPAWIQFPILTDSHQAHCVGTTPPMGALSLLVWHLWQNGFDCEQKDHFIGTSVGDLQALWCGLGAFSVFFFILVLSQLGQKNKKIIFDRHFSPACTWVVCELPSLTLLFVSHPQINQCLLNPLRQMMFQQLDSRSEAKLECCRKSFENVPAVSRDLVYLLRVLFHSNWSVWPCKTRLL